MPSLEYLRSFRIGEYAAFDLSLAFLGVMALSPLLSWLFRQLKIEVPFISWVLLTLPIGVLTHLAVGQDTLMTKYFMDGTSHYLLKLAVLVLLVIGISKIKFIRH